MITEEKIKAVLFGVGVADALGVPVEFMSRQAVRENEVNDMIGYGTYNMPPGTFSDDSSLTYCCAESLTKDFDLKAMGQNFVNWMYNNYWTARGKMFDVGGTTRNAISRLARGIDPEIAGMHDDLSNGNGSLMRIAPLLFYVCDKPIQERYEITKKVSSLTHAHIRSVIGCFYYLEFARQILLGRDKFTAYTLMQESITETLNALKIAPAEINTYTRPLNNNIGELPDDQISGAGYVVSTLEASIWCLLTTDNYSDAVLKAVNLGEDTDTTAAVTGGLAALLYGLDSIPSKWIDTLSRKDDIADLAHRMAEKLVVPATAEL